MAVIENSLEASAIKPEAHTFVPFIPNIFPESTPAVIDETPLTSSAEEESTVDSAEEPGDIITSGAHLETITEQGEEAEPEVEEIPPTEPDDGGEAEPEEQVTDGKAASGLDSADGGKAVGGCCYGLKTQDTGTADRGKIKRTHPQDRKIRGRSTF